MKIWSSQWTQFMQLRKEAWKNFRTSTGFEPVTSQYRCDALPTELWSHWCWEQVSCGFICSREYFFFFFSGFFTQLHKLRSLRRSLLRFHFISAAHIWFISYIINNLESVIALKEGSWLIEKLYQPVDAMLHAKSRRIFDQLKIRALSCFVHTEPP